MFGRYLRILRASGHLGRGRAVHPIKWKAKYGGVDVSGARRLKTFEDEHAKLKRMLAETMQDNTVLKDLLGKH